MHILMLAQFYPPIIGGEERHVRNLSLELVARGYKVSVATLWQEGDQRIEDDQGVRVYRIRASMRRISFIFSEQDRQHAPPFPDPEVLWALRRIIMQEKPDIIHAHNWIVHSFTPIKTWSRAKLVVTLHDYSLLCATTRLMCQGTPCDGPGVDKCLRCASEHYGFMKGIPTTLANWASKRVELRTVDQFLPVSQAVAKGNQLALHHAPYRVIPNFVPDTVDRLSDETHPLLSQLPQEDFLLFVGDAVRDKGIEILFQAHRGMEKPVPLVVIGRMEANSFFDPPLHSHILQSWPHEAVMGAWNRCMIALVPSIWPDPCPTVALEAMAMGKPVIASRIGGLSDIVLDGETGLLIAPGDPRALREAIQMLMADPARRQHMGVMAEKRMRNFQAKRVVPLIEEVYQELVGRPRVS